MDGCRDRDRAKLLVAKDVGDGQPLVDELVGAINNCHWAQMRTTMRRSAGRPVKAGYVRRRSICG